MRERPRRLAVDQQRAAIGREREGRSGRLVPTGILERARAGERGREGGRIGDGDAEVTRDQRRRIPFILDPAIDEDDRGAAARREVDRDPQARAGIEGMEQPFVARHPRAALDERTRRAQRAAPDEARARVFVAGEAQGFVRADTDRMK